MLTQSEIDALLAGAIEIEGQEGSVNLAEMMSDPAQAKPQEAGAGGGGHKILPFNFWSPDRFSKEQMRAVELVHEDLAEHVERLPHHPASGSAPGGSSGCSSAHPL